jgi:hypothetical protein
LRWLIRHLESSSQSCGHCLVVKHHALKFKVATSRISLIVRRP